MKPSILKRLAEKCASENVDRKAVKAIRDTLEGTDKGTIRGTMQNYMTVLREDPLLAGRESRWESPFDSLTERNAGI